MQLNTLSSSPVTSTATPKATAQNPKLLHTLLSVNFNKAVTFIPQIKTSVKRNLTVKCRQSDYYQQPQSQYSSSRPSNNDSSFSTFSSSGSLESNPKVFVNYSIYKGKAALSVGPRAPEFAALDSGAFKIAREGFVLLEFAPAAGTRQYDWGRKQVFSLSVVEIGSLLSLGARDSCEFFHDPNKGKSDEGKVRKVLKVEPLPDGSGYFFNLSVQNKPMNLDENIYIPVTKAEFTILTSAFNYVIPYLLGWNTFANSVKPGVNVNNASPKFGGDYEWSR